MHYAGLATPALYAAAAAHPAAPRLALWRQTALASTHQCHHHQLSPLLLLLPVAGAARHQISCPPRRRQGAINGREGERVGGWEGGMRKKQQQTYSLTVREGTGTACRGGRAVVHVAKMLCWSTAFIELELMTTTQVFCTLDDMNCFFNLRSSRRCCSCFSCCAASCCVLRRGAAAAGAVRPVLPLRPDRNAASFLSAAA